MITELAESPPIPRSDVDILDRAVQHNASVEQIKALCDFIEKERLRQAKIAFNRAMQDAQTEMPAVIVRSKLNEGTNSKYAPIEHILAACRPVWIKHGFTVSFSELPARVVDHVTMQMEIEHAGGHTKAMVADVPISLEGPKGGKLAMNKTQAHGAVMLYAQRYLTKMAFNIVEANTDDDAAGTTLYIGDEELKHLNELWTKADANWEAFMRWVLNREPTSNDTFADIPLKRYVEACKQLERMIAKREKGGAGG